jgi:hypothetical protein
MMSWRRMLHRQSSRPVDLAARRRVLKAGIFGSARKSAIARRAIMTLLAGLLGGSCSSPQRHTNKAEFRLPSTPAESAVSYSRLK